MKITMLLVASAVLISSCGAQKTKSTNVNPLQYAETITAADLETHLYTYASDEFEGRNTGEPGQKKAVEYLKSNYIKFGIPSPISKDDYFQDIPASYFRGDVKASENVVAFIEGSEKPSEILVLTSHLDHVGMKGDQIFNGADDDGSGTVAMLEMAEAFQKAVNDGYRPKRSILFLHVTAEEIGLVGSRFYTENPIFPLENTVANLNTDMIGRRGYKKEDNDNYVYLIGSDKLSTELHELSEAVNEKYLQMELDYTYNDENDPNRFYYRSDHYNFAKNNIPIIFYFNGVHDDYHKPTDTPDKIDYELLEKRTKLIFLTAWEIANREKRPVVDKAQ